MTSLPCIVESVREHNIGRPFGLPTNRRMHMKGVLVEGEITQRVEEKVVDLLGTNEYYEVSQNWYDDSNGITVRTNLLYTGYQGEPVPQDIESIVCDISGAFKHNYMEALDENNGVLDTTGLWTILDSNPEQRIDIVGWFKTYIVVPAIIQRDI